MFMIRKGVRVDIIVMRVDGSDFWGRFVIFLFLVEVVVVEGVRK